MSADLQAKFDLYCRLRAYLGLTEEDEVRVCRLRPIVEFAFNELIDDFYEEILRHPAARRVITGGTAQIERLKRTLVGWLDDFFTRPYTVQTVSRRWQVGLRHVRIGLDQNYVHAALGRLRWKLMHTLQRRWIGTATELAEALQQIARLLDLDLAIIQDAYQSEYVRRTQENERLATIGRVSAGIAHELRNPLNVISTSVYYLLKARQVDPEKRREHLQRIERQVNQAEEVIGALTEFARLSTRQEGTIDIRKCLETCLQEEALPNGVALRFDFDNAAPLIPGDARQFALVVRNLLRNACEAMPSGGTLSISTAHDETSVRITFSDTGRGISPEHLPRLGEPLFSTKPRGIGMGLAIVRAILEKHNARLEVDSQQGVGSSFTLVFPIT